MIGSAISTQPIDAEQLSLGNQLLEEDPARWRVEDNSNCVIMSR